LYIGEKVIVDRDRRREVVVAVKGLNSLHYVIKKSIFLFRLIFTCPSNMYSSQPSNGFVCLLSIILMNIMSTDGAHLGLVFKAIIITMNG